MVDNISDQGRLTPRVGGDGVKPLAIGVDIGGTKLAFVLTNENGDVLAVHQLPTLAAEGADAVLDRIAEGIHHLLDQTSEPVAGIGICAPGQVNPDTGFVHSAVNMNWNDLDLRGGVRDRLMDDLPIWLQKDANGLALGELYFGAARGAQDFVYASIGTGLGGAAITSGRLITGATFIPTEIGHISLDPNGRICSCGRRGCAEAYISGHGILEGVRTHRDSFPQSPLAQMDAPTTADVLSAAREGDSLALVVLDESGRWLGAIIAFCAGILNPSLVVIGGGLGVAAYDEILAPMWQELSLRVLPSTVSHLKIVRSTLTTTALGAAALVWHGHFSQH